MCAVFQYNYETTNLTVNFSCVALGIVWKQNLTGLLKCVYFLPCLYNFLSKVFENGNFLSTIHGPHYNSGKWNHIFSVEND